MRGWLAVGAISVLVLAASTAPAGARTTSQPERSVVVDGSLTYAWHGDPARGCAAAHVCGIAGAIIISGADGGNLTLKRALPRELDFGGGAATVRVQRVGPDGSVSDCVESLDEFDLLVAFVRPRAGGARAFVAPMSVSHCATPLVDDLARLKLDARFAASRPASIDLRQRVAFASGPYSGELTSTLTTHPDPSGFSSSSSESGPGSSPATHRKRFAYVAMRYRATFAGARPEVSYFGGSNGVCVVFDSCGVSGSTTISVPAATFTFRITASRPVRRPLGRARTLADLAAGRLTIDRDLFAGRKLHGAATTLSTRSGTTDCESTRRGLPLTLRVDGYGGGGAGRALDFALNDASEMNDALRAYCAGPTPADELGSDYATTLLSGVLPLKDLAPPQSSLTIAPARRFHAIPYSGRWEGARVLVLKRIGLRTGTRWERVF
jgi:hypothetical protein